MSSELRQESWLGATFSRLREGNFQRPTAQECALTISTVDLLRTFHASACRWHVSRKCPFRYFVTFPLSESDKRLLNRLTYLLMPNKVWCWWVCCRYVHSNRNGRPAHTPDSIRIGAPFSDASHMYSCRATGFWQTLQHWHISGVKLQKQLFRLNSGHL